MWYYYSGNLKYLAEYVNKHVVNFLFNLLIIGLLIYLFRQIGKIPIHGGAKAGGNYKKRLKLIASRPLSAALIVGLFAGTLFYPYRPLLFMDISRIIISLPIVLILIGILPRKYHMYAYIFGLAIILQIIYLNLPIDNIISRIILLTIALMEIFPLIHFQIKHGKRFKSGGTSSRLIRYILFILLIVSSLGLLGNLFGRVMFSLMMVESVLGFILISIIIILSALVINGLLVMLIDSKYSEKLNIIRKNRDYIIIKITKVVNIAAIVLLGYYMLRILNIEVIVVEWINTFFLKQRNIGSIEYSWGGILLFFFVIWLSTVIGSFLRYLLEEDVLNRVKLEKGLPHTIALLVKYSLVTLGVFVAVSAAGFPLDSLTVILGAFGVGIGFGLQNIFNNLVSGLILLFERPIKISDTIEVGTLMGNVRSIGIRSSNIRTFDGAEIIVPNGNLISNEVINWTLSDKTRRIEVIVGVSYDSDPHKVHDILLKVITDHEEIVKDPKPNVFFMELGESSLNFRLLSWTSEFDQWIRIKSEIIFGVFDALKAEGIEIPFPQRDLHVRSIEQGIEVQTKKT
jgi:small-conductance mechanosensitive channel